MGKTAKENIITKGNRYVDEFLEGFNSEVKGIENVKLNGMKLTITGYRIFDKESGNYIADASAMCGGLLGLMRMYTFICAPRTVDAPIFSYDRITAGPNDILICEGYDTYVTEKARMTNNLLKTGAEYPEVKYALSERWYDDIALSSNYSYKAKAKAYGALFDEKAEASILNFRDYLKNAEPCDEKAKYEKNLYYVNGLLTHGGGSTDTFMKSVGKEKTEKLYYELIFGIGTMK